MRSRAKTLAGSVLVAAVAAVIALCGHGVPAIDSDDPLADAPVLDRSTAAEHPAVRPSLAARGDRSTPVVGEHKLDPQANSPVADRIQIPASLAGVVRRAGGTPVDWGRVHLLRAGQDVAVEPLRGGGAFAFFGAPADLGPDAALYVWAGNGTTATFAAGSDPPLPADWTRRQDLVLAMPPAKPTEAVVLWADGSPATDFYFFAFRGERPTGDGRLIGADGHVRIYPSQPREPWTTYGVSWSARADLRLFVAVVPVSSAPDGVLRLDRPPPSTRRAVAVRRDGRRSTSARLAVRVGDQTRPVAPEADGSFSVRLLSPDAPYEVLHVPLEGDPEPLRRLGPGADGIDAWEWTRAPVATATLEFLQADPPDRRWTRFRGTIGPLVLHVVADEPFAAVEIAAGECRLEGEWAFADAPPLRATTDVRVGGDVGPLITVRPPCAVASDGSARLRLARIRLAYPDGRVPPVIDVSRCRPDAAAASRELGSNWHDERLTSGRDGFAAVARSTATRDGEHRFWLHDDGKPFLLLLDGMAAEQVFGPFSASASGDLETTLRFDRFGERVLRMVDAKGEPVAGRVFAVPPRGFAPKFLQTSTAGGYVRSATAEVVDVFLVSDGVSEEATTVRTFDRVARGVRAKNDSTTPDVVVRAELLPDRPTKPVDR